MSKNRKHIEKEIDRCLEEMSWEHGDTEKYTAMAENVERLMHAKSFEEPKFRINADTVFETIGRLADGVIRVGGTIVVTCLVLRYEKYDPLTGKAPGFIPKIRI